MIFLLDLLLFLNIYIAYKYFKYIISPPFLMGMGMLVASLVATCYYDEWDLNEMSIDTVLIIGGGTLLFTISCIVFSQRHCFISSREKHEINFSYVYVKRLKVFLSFLVILGVYTTVFKIRFYAASLGANLDMSSLILSAREEFVDNSSSFQLPFYIKYPSYISSLSSFLSVWLLALQCHTPKKDHMLILLLLSQICIVCTDGLLSGAKGGVMDPIIYFLIAFIMVSYYKNNSVKMPRSFYKKMLVVFCIFIATFQTFNSVMGREMDLSSTDFFAAYCGAELKNFDIYIQDQYKFGKSKYWGGTTFSSLYKDLGVKDNDSGRRFEIVNNHYLGNVHTQYYSFHRDWGVVGIILVIIIIAYISIRIYRIALKPFQYNELIPNLPLFIYFIIANNLFMSFFSSRITEGMFHVGFLKTSICLSMVLYIFNYYLVKKRRAAVN